MHPVTRDQTRDTRPRLSRACSSKHKFFFGFYDVLRFSLRVLCSLASGVPPTWKQTTVYNKRRWFRLLYINQATSANYCRISRHLDPLPIDFSNVHICFCQ